MSQDGDGGDAPLDTHTRGRPQVRHHTHTTHICDGAGPPATAPPFHFLHRATSLDGGAVNRRVHTIICYHEKVPTVAAHQGVSLYESPAPFNFGRKQPS